MNQTPGKWEHHPNLEQDAKKSGYIVIQATSRDAQNIAMVIPCVGMNTEEVLANAKLIAAAPDMLNALIEAKTIIYNLYYNIEKRKPIDLMAMIDPAINKATL